ncbi:hypothetical protein ACRALDRAFT_2058287 [Sodiomyces alcalophilus JCM 7366]|uniref:uncharacterized protein n=1 Tax=Sodiomyces alcalophilus JCM 7366 TaxID=591952 RepID=UPI0039B6DE52
MATPKLQDLPAPLPELVNYIADRPETPVDDIIKPYRQYENELRSIFAQDPKNPVLGKGHVNVLPLFNENTKKIVTRARDPASASQAEKDRYIMPLPDDKRRVNGSPAVVQSLQEFRSNLSIFSESSLVDMDWDNVVAAGSSVVNCLLPVPPEFKASKRKLREYYHEKFCPASDVDLFLYGLTHDEAVEKIKRIEQAVRDAILSEVTVVRTKYAITIASQYPIRHVQIVLRVYKSVDEILTGFDIDAAGAAYDGSQVWVTPRALGSYITQVNHIDLTRRSPSYENRLSKYSHRGFEIYWPELDRSRIDPTIFERSFQRTLGLARLLVLERLPTPEIRETYLNQRREERGRPRLYNSRQNRLYGNIKDDHEDEVADWVEEQEVSNYNTFTVPYGPRFHAKKIEKLCYTRDLLLNAEWNQPKGREVYLHRHPAFFGRVEDVVEDCCGSCPVPVTPEEIQIAETEASRYVSGKVSFLTDDPGRQQIGSFHPLTADDWTDMAYVGNTARLCQSIVDGNVDEVLDWLSQEGANPNTRDYTGRTPLHLAVISSTPDVVRCLVDHGARLTARVADGSTALHLAAERGNVEMVKILMEKSIANEAEEEEKQDIRRKALREAAADKAQMSRKDSGENDGADADADGQAVANPEKDDDDSALSDGELIDGEETDVDAHSIVTGSFVNLKKEAEEKQQGDVDEADADDTPDFYTTDVLAWDIPASPLHLAIAEGHEDVVHLLCSYGSDALLPVKFLDTEKNPTGAILTLSLALTLPPEQAKSMATALLKNGATCSQADLHGCTALHRFVQDGSLELIDKLIENDKRGVKTAVNHLVTGSQRYWSSEFVAPIHTAIEDCDKALVLKLLDAGANPEISFDTWLKAAKFSQMKGRLNDYESNKKLFAENVRQPLIVALQACPDPQLAMMLLKRGADPNAALTRSTWRGDIQGLTALDMVRTHLEHLRMYTGEVLRTHRPKAPGGMDEYLQGLEEGTYRHWTATEDIRIKKEKLEEQQRQFEMYENAVNNPEGIPEKKAAIQEAISDLEELEQAIVDKGGKTFRELHPDSKPIQPPSYGGHTGGMAEEPAQYRLDISFWNVTDVTEARQAAYIDLFEAAWAGNLERITELTTQAWGENSEEAPLKIAVTDNNGNSPFSLAFLRGHRDVAKAILEIVKLQYSPDDAESRHGPGRGSMDDEDDYSCSDGNGSESGSDDSDGMELRAEPVDQKFTIDNIGQKSMQVKSTTKPMEVLLRNARCFNKTGGEIRSSTLFSFVIMNDDRDGFESLMDMAMHFSKQRLPGDEDDEDARRCFSFPEADFLSAIMHGRLTMLSHMIKEVGAGIPLGHLVQKSGIELKEKPKYYQGLTVYGKKRKDWAAAGRNVVVQSTGVRTPPLLHAALHGHIELVEWFLSDAPQRCYAEFGQSEAAMEDPRLKHLRQAPGGFDRAVSRWLGAQNELILHCAVLGPREERTNKLIKYLIQACPSALEYKSSAGETPLHVSFSLGRTEFAKTLIEGGADQAARSAGGDNVIHAALKHLPKAHLLKPMLDLLDPGLRSQLLLQRNKLSEGGNTPIHSWGILQSRTPYRTANEFPYTDYVNKWEVFEVLDLLLGYSGGAELGMLNGAGQTLLHSAAMAGNSDMVEGILKYDAKLLFRENAAGRTPAEVARGQVTQAKFRQPQEVTLRHSGYDTEHGPSRLAAFPPRDFLTAKAQGRLPGMTGAKKQGAQQWQRVWDAMADYVAQRPGKRRLVSLGEANDVAKRLSEQFGSNGDRSAKRRRGDDGEEEEDKDHIDFAVQQQNRKVSEAWKP